MLEKYLRKVEFDSLEDFRKNFEIIVPDNFNFGYDVVDEWARTDPDKLALLWTNDEGREQRYTFADIKRKSDQVASFYQSLGIGHGDCVMMMLKRRAEFWFSIVALHKLGAVAIPATHLLTSKDLIYRANSAKIKMIVSADEPIMLPCGRSAHTEAGWFAGRGKLTIAYIPERQEPELMYKLFNKVCCSIEELIEALK